MSSSRLSDLEVEASLGDNDLEISFTSTSQIPDLPHLPGPSHTRNLPSRKPLTNAFLGLSLGQSGTPASQTTSTTCYDPSTSANLLRSGSGSRPSPGVSSLESSTDRWLRTVAPAVVGELRENTAAPVEYDAFVKALSLHAPGPRDDTALLADNQRVDHLVQSCPGDVKAAWLAYVQSAKKSDEKAQYQPFSELCNAITDHVRPLKDSDGATKKGAPKKRTTKKSTLEKGAAMLYTRRNDPKRLVCSREDAMRSPDVITGPTWFKTQKEILMADVYLLWEFKQKLLSEDDVSASKSESTSKASQRQDGRTKSASQPTHPPPSSSKISEIGVQLGVYVTEAFSSGPLRSHMICGSVQQGHMSLWWFDRAGVVRTNPIDLQQPVGLDCLIKLFYHLSRLNRRGWGFVWNPSLTHTPSAQRPKQHTPRYATRSTTEDARPSTKSIPLPSNLTEGPDDSAYLDMSMEQNSRAQRKDPEADVKEDGRKAKFRRTNPLFGWTVKVGNHLVHISQSLYRQYGLFSRGVYVTDGEMVIEDGKKIDVVVKFSWQLLGLAQEYELAQRAQEAAKEEKGMLLRLPHLYAQEGWNSTNSAFRQHLNTSSVKPRQLFILVAERLERMATIDNAEDLKKVVLDVAHCHRWLMRQVGIFHRDISFENIMVRRRDGTVSGVLNDFDLALDLCPQSEEPPGRAQITGTRLFMARELLELNSQAVHSGRHDMESLFWVVIWFIYRYQDGKECEPGPNRSRPFDDWLTTSDLASKKSHFLVNAGSGLELPSVWKNTWIRWARNLAIFHRNATLRRIDLLDTVKLAEPLTQEDREFFENRVDELDFKDDSTAWKAFVKAITGVSPEDYPWNPLYQDYDTLSTVQF